MGNPDQQPPLTGQVQADETYVGGKYRVGSGENRKSQFENKTPVVALVETSGEVRARPVEAVDSKNLARVLDEYCHPSAQIVTDEHSAYPFAVLGFGGHHTVNHSAKQYARKRIGDDGEVETITTNSAESFFSLLKRGLYGTFHHVSKRHLHRYCDEFSFRWNGRRLDDIDRCERAIKRSEGRRLMYRLPAKGPLEGRATSGEGLPN
jgi:hypothetical protein